MKLFLTLLGGFFCTVVFAQKDFSYYFNSGQEKYEKGNYAEGANDFGLALKNRNIAKNDYQIANAYRGRALCKMKLKNYSSAISDMAFAIELKPEYSELYNTISLIHLESKEYDACKSWADKGLKLKPEFEELFLLKARACFEQKKFEEASQLLDTLLSKINGKNIEALSLLGTIKERKKDFNEGISVFSKIIDIDAQNHVAFYSRGICYARVKDFKQAKADITRGMELDSTEKWVGYNNIAFFIYFEQQDFAGAIPLFDDAIKMNPKFSYAYNNRGYAKLKLKDISGAKADVLKSLSLDKSNAYAYKTLAQVLIAEKKEKEACEKLYQAIKLGYSDEYDEDAENLIKEHCK